MKYRISKMHEGKDDDFIADFYDLSKALEYLANQLQSNAPNNELSVVKVE